MMSYADENGMCRLLHSGQKFAEIFYSDPQIFPILLFLQTVIQTRRLLLVCIHYNSDN